MPCSYWQETTEFTPESHFLTVLCALQLLAGDNRIHPRVSFFDCFMCLAAIGRRQHNSPPSLIFWLFCMPCSYWQETTEFTPESHFLTVLCALQLLAGDNRIHPRVSFFDCFMCLAAIGRRQHNSPPSLIFWLFYVPCSYWQETTQFTA